MQSYVSRGISNTTLQVVDTVRSKHDSSLFQPHTHAVLLGIIENALAVPDSQHIVLMPETQSRLEQAALYAFGHTVEWCWMTWDDERVIEYDTILSLVGMVHLDIRTCINPPIDCDLVISSTASKLAF